MKFTLSPKIIQAITDGKSQNSDGDEVWHCGNSDCTHIDYNLNDAVGHYVQTLINCGRIKVDGRDCPEDGCTTRGCTVHEQDLVWIEVEVLDQYVVEIYGVSYIDPRVHF